METLDDARKLGLDIEVRCQQSSRIGTVKVGRCQNTTVLHLATLIATRGHSFPLSLLQSRLKCDRCGSRHIVVVFRGGGTGGVAAMGRR